MVTPVPQTGLGQLYQGDCLEWLPTLADESVDLVFADPPFNLNKDYGAGVSDRLKDTAYLDWCAAWIKECARVTKPGGAVWTDIAPVRHRGQKHRSANQLSEKMLERVLTISSEPGDLVIDPFGGSGTTFAVAERMHRHWAGCELGDADPLVRRLTGLDPQYAPPGHGDAGKGSNA